MRNFFVPLSRESLSTSTLVTALAGLLLAGCSSSIDRFTDYPGESDNTHTASAPSRGRGSGGDEIIQSSPLAGGSSRNHAQAGYSPPKYEPDGRYRGAAAGSATGEGSVVVAQGQTLYSIARAHRKSVQSVASANGIPAPYHVRVGQRILIPDAGGSPDRVELAKAPASGNLPRSGRVHSVRSGDTLFSLGRKYKLHPYAIADLNGLSHTSPLHLGQKVRIPAGGTRVASAPAIAAEAPVADRAASDGFEDTQIGDAGAESGKSQQRLEEEPLPGGEADEAPSSAEEPAVEQNAVQNFRWPVRGRVISTFGDKPGGMRNEGINIAVPEGAGVRAADSGVVAYAGNELKGYGNLVLIRHQGGWVTAYAHNKELIVKRGDTVKRGDMIAKAGRTGSVESPQLHFELRKGATAVDPVKYLTSATVAN